MIPIYCACARSQSPGLGRVDKMLQRRWMIQISTTLTAIILEHQHCPSVKLGLQDRSRTGGPLVIVGFLMCSLHYLWGDLAACHSYGVCVVDRLLWWHVLRYMSCACYWIRSRPPPSKPSSRSTCRYQSPACTPAVGHNYMVSNTAWLRLQRCAILPRWLQVLCHCCMIHADMLEPNCNQLSFTVPLFAPP